MVPPVTDSVYSCVLFSIDILHYYSCLGHRDDLDGDGKELRRSERLTANIRQKLSDKKAWEEWGIVNDVLVWWNSA